MVYISHDLFNRVSGQYGDKSCQVFLHPYTPSCLHAQREMILVSLKGSAKYFFLMYLAQNAFKYKTLSAEDIKPIALSYIRSLVTGVWAVSSCFGVVCLIKKLTGRIPKDAIAYTMGFTSGLSVYISDEKRRPIMAYTLAAYAAEALLRRLYRKVNRSEAIETMVFMVLNGILMYKMRVTELARCSRDMWFFRPPRIRSDKKVEETVDGETGETLINACPHAEKGCTREQCLKSILKETSKYYVGSMIFTAVKLLVTKPALRRSPVLFVKTIVQWNNLRLACFFGWYVGVYEAISCLLCRWRKQDKAEHALIAGCLAGLSYGMNTNLTLLGTIILYVARILGREYQNEHNLRKFHFVELNMILALTILINTRIFDPENTPGGFRFMVNTITQSKLDRLFTNFLKIITEQKAKGAV